MTPSPSTSKDGCGCFDCHRACQSSPAVRNSGSAFQPLSLLPSGCSVPACPPYNCPGGGRTALASLRPGRGRIRLWSGDRISGRDCELSSSGTRKSPKAAFASVLLRLDAVDDLPEERLDVPGEAYSGAPALRTRELIWCVFHCGTARASLLETHERYTLQAGPLLEPDGEAGRWGGGGGSRGATCSTVA